MSTEREGFLRVMIVFSASGGLGGSERSLSRMALANDQRDIRYTLGTFGGEGAWADWIRHVGHEPFVLDLLSRKLSWPRDLVKFLLAVRVTKPDILYVVGVRSAILIRLLKPFLDGAKIVHGIRTTFQRGSSIARKFGPAERLFRGLTDAYIANSYAGAQTLSTVARIPFGRFHIIPNGISVPDGALPPLASRPRVVIVVANIHPVKGHREFLNVAMEVHRAHPDVVFNFVGRDDSAGEIQRLASKKGISVAVRFRGFQADVWPWLIAAQIFVLPSRGYEGAPTSIIEAQGAGLPTVAFAVGGVPELIRDGIDGHLIQPDNDAAMAEKIIALLSDIPRAAAMGEHARDKVRRLFTLQASVHRHAEVWRSLARTGERHE